MKGPHETVCYGILTKSCLSGSQTSNSTTGCANAVLERKLYVEWMPPSDNLLKVPLLENDLPTPLDRLDMVSEAAGHGSEAYQWLLRSKKFFCSSVLLMPRNYAILTRTISMDLIYKHLRQFEIQMIVYLSCAFYLAIVSSRKEYWP